MLAFIDHECTLSCRKCSPAFCTSSKAWVAWGPVLSLLGSKTVYQRITKIIPRMARIIPTTIRIIIQGFSTHIWASLTLRGTLGIFGALGFELLSSLSSSSPIFHKSYFKYINQCYLLNQNNISNMLLHTIESNIFLPLSLLNFFWSSFIYLFKFLFNITCSKSSLFFARTPSLKSGYLYLYFLFKGFSSSMNFILSRSKGAIF